MHCQYALSCIQISPLTFYRAIACGATRMAIFAELLGPACRHYVSRHLRWTELTCPVFSESDAAGVSTSDSLGTHYLYIPSARTFLSLTHTPQESLAFLCFGVCLKWVSRWSPSASPHFGHFSIPGRSRVSYAAFSLFYLEARGIRVISRSQTTGVKEGSQRHLLHKQIPLCTRLM